MPTMRIRVKRALLGTIAFALVALAGWPDLIGDAALGRQEITETPTATSTRPPVHTEITFPQPGDILFGSVDIEGAAIVDNFLQYQMHIAPAGSEEWQWLTTQFIFRRDPETQEGEIGVVRDGILHTLDTPQWPDGFYDLRLRSIRVDGNYIEAFVRTVEIRNQDPPSPTPSATMVSPLGTPSPPETPSPLETPSPAPENVSFIPGGPGIYEPRHAERLQGYVEINGSANAPDPHHRFLRADLHFSPAGQEDWNWLHSSQEQRYQRTLYVLDTTRLDNGVYDLRLRIVYWDGNYDEFFVHRLQVANPVGLEDQPIVAIKAPQDGAAIHGEVDVVGTIVHPNFLRWELHWSPSGEESWHVLFRADYQVVDEVIARVDVGSLPVADYDLRLRVVTEDGNYEDHFIRRLHIIIPTPTPVYPCDC